MQQKNTKFLRGLALITALLFLGLTGCSETEMLPSQSDFTSVPADTQPQQDVSTSEIVYKAMWISYLDWGAFDMTSEQTFTQSVGTVFDNCANMGLNTVIVQVRPFSDAIYKSDIYPWSHVLTGTQGQDPGYDPLEIMIAEAHARHLSFEAWINPYRISLNDNLPGSTGQDSPALLNPDWVRQVGDGLYFDPSIPQVQEMIIEGTLEIINNYDVNGIQFDDYFYPTTDASFDEENYKATGGGLSLEEWRRENVNTLVKNLYAEIKAADPNCVFGISPQGNNDNNYNQQYSDVNLWLSTPGYVDYIMPQIYWGFGYTLSSGSQKYAFENISKEWIDYPRHEDVALAIGLGAYRIGVGDGGTNDQSQWMSGENLAVMTEHLESITGVDGIALFRYANLFDGSNDYQKEEVLALTEALS